MKVRVKLFAVAREIAGRDAVDVALAPEATIGGLRKALAEQVPELAALARQAMFAVDADYAGDDARIAPNAEVACIPPVSGG